VSGGGVHESTDGGQHFAPLVDGLAVVEGFDPGDMRFHDPHCVRLCSGNPDRLYQQNHCGIYRLDRPDTRWRRIGATMPQDVGDIGFPLVVHPRDHRVAWVLPMEALQSYTGGPWVEAEGATVGAVLDDLDRRYPGIRFRMVDEQGAIRRHMRIFWRRAMVFDLSTPLAEDGELMIVHALSGG
jgi:molybdopterin converting factor small subunit